MFLAGQQCPSAIAKPPDFREYDENQEACPARVRTVQRNFVTIHIHGTLSEGSERMDTNIIILGLALSNWSIIANIAVAFATLLMAYATWKMAKVTQKMFDEQNKPYVIVYAKQRENVPHVLQLVVENVGTVPAYNVQFIISDNFFLEAWGIEEADGQPQKPTNGPFINGIVQLVPNQKKVFNWGQYGGIKDSLQSTHAKITAKFQNASGVKQPVTENILDIRDFTNSTADTPTAAKQLNEITKIPKNLEALTKLLDRKLQPQSPETTYMWAYIAWKLLEEKYPLEYIYKYGKGAGLTNEQIEHARKQADNLLREYRPELCQNYDQ